MGKQVERKRISRIARICLEEIKKRDLKVICLSRWKKKQIKFFEKRE